MYCNEWRKAKMCVFVFLLTCEPLAAPQTAVHWETQHNIQFKMTTNIVIMGCKIWHPEMTTQQWDFTSPSGWRERPAEPKQWRRTPPTPRTARTWHHKHTQNKHATRHDALWPSHGFCMQYNVVNSDMISTKINEKKQKTFLPKSVDLTGLLHAHPKTQQTCEKTVNVTQHINNRKHKYNR